MQADFTRWPRFKIFPLLFSLSIKHSFSFFASHSGMQALCTCHVTKVTGLRVKILVHTNFVVIYTLILSGSPCNLCLNSPHRSAENPKKKGFSADFPSMSQSSKVPERFVHPSITWIILTRVSQAIRQKVNISTVWRSSGIILIIQSLTDKAARHCQWHNFC